MNLLDKALKAQASIAVTKPLTARDPEIDLAIKFSLGAISADAVALARGTTRTACYAWVGGVLMRAVRVGALQTSAPYRRLKAAR